MSDKVSLVRVLTAATGNSTPITLGARYSDLFMTPADAGAVDGRTYTWLIVDGNNWELVKGVYTASGTTAARTTVLASRNAGTLGTSRITLSGTAQVRIVESSYDMDGVRGTRSVTGTSDTLASTDLGYVVSYLNASPIAVSLAQAGTAGLLDGWATWVQNLGGGTVTITPVVSSFQGLGATLVLATNMGAFIWSDGTNYHAYFVPVSKPLLAANNLSDVANAATARGNLGAGTGNGTVTTSGTPTSSQVAVFSAGSVIGGTPLGSSLTSSGGTLNVASHILLNTVTASGSTQSIGDTTSLTSAYSIYEIEFINVVPTTNAVTFELFIQSGGTVQTTGYLGVNSLIGATQVIANPTTMVQLSGASSVQSSGSGYCGFLRIYNPAGTSAPKPMHGQGTCLNATPFYVTSLFSGAWNGGNGSVTGFTVQFTAGNIASGVIKVYGIL